jgi:hypothetical protein
MVRCTKSIIQTARDIPGEAKASFVQAGVCGRRREGHGPPEVLGVGWSLLVPLLTAASGPRQPCAAAGAGAGAGAGASLGRICLRRLLMLGSAVAARCPISLPGTRGGGGGPKEKEPSHASGNQKRGNVRQRFDQVPARILDLWSAKHLVTGRSM